MSRVFVIQKQVRRDRSTGQLVPAYDVEPATDYGELVYLLGPEDTPLRSKTSISKLREGLSDFGPEDYLLLIGNPCFIGWATAIACHASGGRVRHLQWHGRSQSYIAVSADVFEP